MVRNHCIRSIIVSSIFLAIIIVSQLFLIDDTSDTISDTETFWQQNDVSISKREDLKWNRQRATESFSLICPNCTFRNVSAINRTNVNDTMLGSMILPNYLRGYIRQLNAAPVVRNLDKFDLEADSDGSLVIVVQVSSCLLFICCRFLPFCIF